MIAFIVKRSRISAILAGMGLVLVLGCGDSSGLATRYPVSGTVTYKGQPVEKGTIGFIPTEADGRPATGELKDGAYSLTTLTPNDGALPGSYKVTVVSVDMDTTQIKAIAEKTGGAAHHDMTFAKAVKTAKKLVPSKYSLADTSGLTAEVKPQSNTVNFDLTD